MADPYKYFRLEARELVDELGKGTLALEHGASQEIVHGIVQRLLRHAHTLKGAARVVRLPDIADRAHAFEDILEPFRAGTTNLPADQIAALLALVDDVASRLGSLGPAPAPAPAPAPVTAPVAAPPVDAPAPARPAAEAGVPSVRTELAEMDALLDGVIETHARLRVVREATTDLEQARRLADVVIAQLAARTPSPRQLAKSHTLVVELRALLQGATHELENGFEHVERELAQVRETAEHMRLVAVESVFGMLERTVRDTASTLGKRARFEGRGGRVRIDAQVLIALQGALVQLVRNAIAHGIEAPELRAARGKPAVGRIELDVTRRGRRIVISCRDDGQGLDLEAIRQVLQRRGVAVTGALDATELVRLLLRGGISTAGTVTEHAGRGIGLDVVREVSERLAGEIAVRSVPGSGTAFELVVPVSLASVEVLLVEAGGVIAAVPLEAVRGTRRIDDAELSRTAHDETVIHDDVVTPFVSLATLLPVGAAPSSDRRHWIAVIVEGHDGVAAVGVDRLRGTTSAVVRPIPAIAAADPLIAGASLDATGNPQLVLDADHVVLAARRGSPAIARRLARHAVLVIDDSLTTRMLEQSILESAGYEVDTATSGEEGLVAARRKRYALILVDVEMPGIDGFTFVELLRADPTLREIPAILVTSRNAPEDLQRGTQVGAQAYIVKSEFDQLELLAIIHRLVRAS